MNAEQPPVDLSQEISRRDFLPYIPAAVTTIAILGGVGGAGVFAHYAGKEERRRENGQLPDAILDGTVVLDPLTHNYQLESSDGEHEWDKDLSSLNSTDIDFRLPVQITNPEIVLRKSENQVTPWIKLHAQYKEGEAGQTRVLYLNLVPKDSFEKPGVPGDHLIWKDKQGKFTEDGVEFTGPVGSVEQPPIISTPQV